jgi:tetraacyldisaccharide 4'-kinase
MPFLTRMAVDRVIRRAWKGQGTDGRLLRVGLIPLSLLFATAVELRALAYKLRLRRRRQLEAAVVSVGNLSVGGNGKTPTTLWLSERLRARGYVVAIVLRGHGGSARGPTVVGRARSPGVAASPDPAVVGDEGAMLARRFDGPVVVGRDRAEAGALACREFGAEVLVLDDGFQHWALRRDFDLVCLRARGLGGGHMLPAGSLREPIRALRRAQAALVVEEEDGERLGARVERTLAGLPVYHGELRATGLVTPDGEVWRELPMGALAAHRALGVAGLADPQPFYRTLQEWDARLDDFLEFPDHHDYTLEDWKKIASRSRGLDLVVTTEKDLVKLERFPFAKDKLAAVRVAMEVEGGERLVESVATVIERRRAERTAPERTP